MSESGTCEQTRRTTTGLLVSVRSAAEALDAWEAGADLVDLKEPSRGALGPVDRRVAVEVAALAQGRAFSMALGELAEPDVERMAPPGVGFVKLGLAGTALRTNWRHGWRAALASLPPGAAGVAVAYADCRAAQAPEPCEVLAEGRNLGCRALLVDTWSKSAGGLFDLLSIARLDGLVCAARDAGMLVVLAGSLTCETLPAALKLRPDFVAVRGAVCRGSRTGPLDAELVRHWVERLRGRGAETRGRGDTE